MMHSFLEIFTDPLIQRLLLVSFLTSIICGIIGTYIVIKRLVFLSGGLAHTSLGGLSMSHHYHLNPFAGAFFFTFLSAIILGFSRSKGKNEDAIMGILWPFSMSLGIVFLSLSPSYGKNLSNYLFGNIFMVSGKDILFMFVLVLLVLSIVIFFFPHLQAVCFDEEFSKVRGLKTNFFYTLLLVLISLAVLMLTKVVGILLLISLLTIPNLISQKFVSSIKEMMFCGALFSLLFFWGGFCFSYMFDCSVGAAIVFFSCFFYIATELLIKKTFFS